MGSNCKRAILVRTPPSAERTLPTLALALLPLKEPAKRREIGIVRVRGVDLFAELPGAIPVLIRDRQAEVAQLALARVETVLVFDRGTKFFARPGAIGPRPRSSLTQ